MKTKWIQVLLLSAVLGMGPSAVYAECEDGTPPQVFTGKLVYVYDDIGYMETDYQLIDANGKAWPLYVEQPFNSNPRAPMGNSQTDEVDAFLAPFVDQVIRVTGCTTEKDSNIDLVSHIERA